MKYLKNFIFEIIYFLYTKDNDSECIFSHKYNKNHISIMCNAYDYL